MRFNVRLGSVVEAPGDVLIANLFEGEKPGGATAALDDTLKGLLSELIEEEGFKGKLGETTILHTHGKIPAKRIMLVGLGKREDFGLDKVRKAAGASAKRAKAIKAKKVVTILHGAGLGGLDAEGCAQALVEGCILGTYTFSKYKSERSDSSYIEQITIVEKDAGKLPAIRRGIERGRIFAEATNFARDLINEPASIITPIALARLAKKIAKEGGLKCQVYGRDWMKRMGMGAILGVSQASGIPPQFIKLIYRPQGKPRKRVALVGKGITFDSGGLNIKTPEWMLTMKDDMSGAAAVLATMRALARLKPDVEVMALIPTTENMPGEKAYKPGDVLTACNKKTIEISNTDAEGRVILADALAYAARQEPDELIDIATLTGACIIALGNTVSGIMGNDQPLIDRIVKAGYRAGEKIWQLPLFEEYREFLKSDVADIKNSGGREAGASQGGIFLREFVGDRKWAHLDIAGPSFIDKEWEECPKGATGVSVRTLLTYLLEG